MIGLRVSRAVEELEKEPTGGGASEPDQGGKRQYRTKRARLHVVPFRKVGAANATRTPTALQP
jgi:hypothetical protein